MSQNRPISLQYYYIVNTETTKRTSATARGRGGVHAGGRGRECIPTNFFYFFAVLINGSILSLIISELTLFTGAFTYHFCNILIDNSLIINVAGLFASFFLKSNFAKKI